MKPAAIFFMLLFVFQQQLRAQTTYQTQFQPTAFNNLYSIYPAQDEGTFVFGDRSDLCSYSDNCNYAVYVYRFDRQGKLVWAKDFSTSFSLARPAAIVTKDGGFAFLGRLYDTITKKWQGGLLVKCNNDGNIAWSKQVNSSRYSAFNPQAIQEDDSGNFLLFYTVSNDMYDPRVLQIVKLNRTGTIVWNRTGRLASSYITDIYQGASFQQIGNRYYVFGENNCQNCDGVLTANILILDTNGNVLTCRDIPTQNNFSTSTTAIRLVAKGSQVYLLGTYGEFAPSYFLMPVTDTSTEAMGTGFPFNSFSLRYQLRNFKTVYPLSLTNSYVINGYFDKKKILHQIIPGKGGSNLARYDSLDRICPSYALPNTDTTTMQQAFYIQPNRFITITDTVSLSDKAVRVSAGVLTATVLCEGDAGADKAVTTLSSLPTGERKITVYPNPAQDVVHISGLQQNAVAIILSSAGSIVKTVPVYSSHPMIAISELKAGIYFLKVTEKDSQSSVVPFVKQ